MHKLPFHIEKYDFIHRVGERIMHAWSLCDSPTAPPPYTGTFIVDLG